MINDNIDPRTMPRPPAGAPASGGMPAPVPQQQAQPTWGNGTANQAGVNTTNTMRAQGLGTMHGNLYNQARGAQNDALAMWLAQAQGQNSVVQEQMRQQAGANLANTVTGSALARGGNLASMSGAAGAAGASQGVALNNAAALARMQEQQAAMQGYAGQANTMADQNLQQQMGFEGMSVEQAMANAAAMNQQQQFARQMRMQEQAQQFQMAMQGIQMAGSMAGGMLSDETRKKDMRDGAAELRSALAQVLPLGWQYNDDVGDPGQKLGVGARQVEATALGNQLIRQTPQGKMLDTNNAAAIALAGTADQERRIAELEALIAAKYPQQRPTTADPFADPRAFAGVRATPAPVPATADPFAGMASRPVSIGDNPNASRIVRGQTPDAAALAPTFDPRRAEAESALRGGLMTRQYGR